MFFSWFHKEKYFPLPHKKAHLKFRFLVLNINFWLLGFFSFFHFFHFLIFFFLFIKSVFFFTFFFHFLNFLFIFNFYLFIYFLLLFSIFYFYLFIFFAWKNSKLQPKTVFFRNNSEENGNIFRISTAYVYTSVISLFSKATSSLLRKIQNRLFLTFNSRKGDSNDILKNSKSRLRFLYLTLQIL